MNEEELLDSLRALAADTPRNAPEYLEQTLVAEFRRRARARRQKVWWTAAGAAGIAAAITAILLVQPAQKKTLPLSASAQQPFAFETDSADVEMIPAVNRTGGEEKFYPLPGSEALAPLEMATVIRVQLPMSSLRLIGFPVSADVASETVLADVVLGQDGLARGVRLVQ